MDKLLEKLERLKALIKNMESVIVAFSGGMDSTFMLKIAHDVLKGKCVAVTAISSTYPRRELEDAKKFAEDIGARHLIIESEELDIPQFRKNPVNRCYYCKKELFKKIKDVAKKEGIKSIADGSNLDDISDFRPGAKALAELNIRSPLKECCFTKKDIRDCSKKLGLCAWNKPSFACLSSRFPYGTEITKERLAKIEKAEEFLRAIGFLQVRVRYHGDIARIEVEKKDFPMLIENSEKITAEFKNIGFVYTAMDLKGYRTGAMNEAIQ